MTYGPPPTYLTSDEWKLFGQVAGGDLDPLRAALASDPGLARAESYWPCEVDLFAVAIHCNQREALELVAGARRYAPLQWAARLAERIGDEGLAHFARELDSRLHVPHDPRFHDLRAAIVARDLKEAEAIASAHPELVNGRDDDGCGSLYWAAWTRNLAMIDLLIAHGADIASQCALRHPPHHAPFRLGIRRRLNPKTHHVNEETVLAYLVAKGAPYDLTTAARLGDYERVEALLAADPTAVNIPGSRGQSAVGQAARSGHIDLVRLLLEAGADPNLPLYGAEHGAAVFAALGNVEMMQLLLEHGADPNAYSDSTGVPIEFVQSEEVVTLLRAAGAVHPAYRAESVQALRAILDEPEEMLRARDGTGWGMLLPQIVKRGDVATLDRYVERVGTETVRTLDPFGGHHVPEDDAMLERLLDHGLDPNRRDAWGCTYLHHARTVERSKLLLERGAQIDPVDFGHGRTPLANAVVAEDLDRIALFRRHGADPTVEGRRPGRSAYALAIASENPAVRAALVE